jgi:hypothetical protein
MSVVVISYSDEIIVKVITYSDEMSTNSDEMRVKVINYPDEISLEKESLLTTRPSVSIDRKLGT